MDSNGFYRKAKKLALMARAFAANLVHRFDGGDFSLYTVVGGPSPYQRRLIELTCLNNSASRILCRDMFGVYSYPTLDFVSDVKLILDAGANIGAASVLFSVFYPKARIMSFEPCRRAFEALTANARQFSNIEPVQAGLLDRDGTAEVTIGGGGKSNSGTAASLFRKAATKAETETITMIPAGEYVAKHGLKIDLLKVDTEGCEVPILRSLGDAVKDVKIIYYEYHSNEDRLTIEAMLAPTHILWSSHAERAHAGNVCWLRKDLLPASVEARAIRMG